MNCTFVQMTPGQKDNNSKTLSRQMVFIEFSFLSLSFKVCFEYRPGAVAAPVSTATMLQPDAVVLNIAAKGAYLGRLSVSQLLVGGWLAGVFLSFGCSLMVQVICQYN